MDPDAKKVAVEWRGYHEEAFTSIDTFRKVKLFTDVTLVIGEAHLPAHRVVLSACSDYFQRTLTKVSHCAHPLIAIQHPKVHIMELLLDYMYRGKVTVDPEDVRDFVRSAEELGIHLQFPNGPLPPDVARDGGAVAASRIAEFRRNAKAETETSHDDSLSDLVSERSLLSSPSPASSLFLHSPGPSSSGDHKRPKLKKVPRSSKPLASGMDHRGSQRASARSHNLDVGGQLSGEDLFCPSQSLKSSPMASQHCFPEANSLQAFPWFQLQNNFPKQNPQSMPMREHGELPSTVAPLLSQLDHLNNPAMIAQSYFEQLQSYGSWMAANFLGSGHSIFAPITSSQLPQATLDTKALSQAYWPEYEQGEMSLSEEQAKKVGEAAAAAENEKLRGRKTKYHKSNDSRDKAGFPCNLCSKVLSDHSSLYRHQKAHKGEKPHECAHCGKKFSQKYNMIQHMKIHLRENPRPTQTEPEAKLADGNAGQ